MDRCNSDSNDLTYYYMVQAGNLGQINNSAQVAETPIADVAPLPVTTISPSETVQNSISVTVTLSATNATTTYYKIGTGGQQTYSNPFTVFQWSAGVDKCYHSYHLLVSRCKRYRSRKNNYL